MGRAILIVDHEPAGAEKLRALLGRHRFETQAAASCEEALERLERFSPDVVLLDLHLPGIDGLETLKRIRAASPEARVVAINGRAGAHVAVDAMKAGAYACLAKPVLPGELEILLDRALRQERLEQALDYYTRRQARGAGVDEIIGECPPMRALKDSIGRLLEAESRIGKAPPPAALITGEIGSGRQLLARALHFGGRRASKPFTEIHCASMPPSQLEAELFGHERGAFAGAKARRTGLAEAADGGTLFLDEIGDTDPATQAKLLKLIEERNIRRVGSARDVEVDVRIVAAAREPLEDRVREGRFRADLLDRLRGVQLRVPPLRERDGDIQLLARHFLEMARRRYRRPRLQLSADAEGALISHKWPGNVRELRNMIEEAALLATGDVIGAAHLPPWTDLGARAAATMPWGGSFPDAGLDLEQVERQLVEQALAKAQWNVTRAARLLNLTRDTLRYRIEKFRLAPPGR